MRNRIQDSFQASADVVVRKQPGPKMSDALVKIIGPYSPETSNRQAFESIVCLGIVGWNLGLKPPAERRPERERLLETLPRVLTQDRPFIRRLVEEFIQRKEELFPDNVRLILDYQVTDVGDGYHVDVVSTAWPCQVHPRAAQGLGSRQQLFPYEGRRGPPI